jgi:selenocysteine lyase/cysteine desulfurase
VIPPDAAPAIPPGDRSAFSIPSGIRYLNCAYMAPLHRDVEAAGIEGVLRKRSPWSIEARHFFEESDVVRGLFARLIGSSEPGRVALLPAASYGLSAAARNAGLRRGSAVVLTEGQFPGNVYPWRRAAAEAGASVRMVAAPAGPGRGRQWNERILDAIGPDTGAVSLGAVHWTDGTRFDLEAIGARAREVGAVLVVDGSQSVGAVPFDVERIRPDALVTVGYKWLLGPYSTALAWYGPRFDDGVPLEETWVSREGSEDFRRLVEYRDAYQPGAVRYDVGERSNFALLPMVAAALRLLLSWTPSAVEAHTRTLTDAVAGGARELGFDVDEPGSRFGHILGLRLPGGVDPATLLDALRARGVHASLRGPALRLSPHLYNDLDDVGAVLEGLRTVV